MGTFSQIEIVSKIHLVGSEKIMLDSDLAELYDVETKYFKRQVRRNIERFPRDFMFELSREQVKNLRSQIGTSRSSWGGTRYAPMAFTEQGVAQLSSVLKSERAINVNIQIIRLFTQMRKLLMNHNDLTLKVEKIEHGLEGQGHEIKVLFEYIRQLTLDKSDRKKQSTRTRIGFTN